MGGPLLTWATAGCPLSQGDKCPAEQGLSTGSQYLLAPEQGTGPSLSTGVPLPVALPLSHSGVGLVIVKPSLGKG